MEEKTTPTREEELARREALLAQREAQLEKEQAAFEAAKAQGETRKKKLLDNNDPDFVNPKEKLYDKFPSCFWCWALPTPAFLASSAAES